MYYELQQKKSEFYVQVRVPQEIKRGCKDSEFQFLDHKEIHVKLDEEHGTDFPDLIMAENYVPMISEKLKQKFDFWGIDNLYYKKMVLEMSDYDIEEIFWLALPPRIDCLDPEESFDKEFGVCTQIVIQSNKVGNYEIFKLKDGNDELIISKKLKELLENEMNSRNIQGLVIKEIRK